MRWTHLPQLILRTYLPKGQLIVSIKGRHKNDIRGRQNPNI